MTKTFKKIFMQFARKLFQNYIYGLSLCAQVYKKQSHKQNVTLNFNK